MQQQQQYHQQTHPHQQQHQHLLPFDGVRPSGIWEGLSFRDGFEFSGDETRWKETSLVFSDFNEKHRNTVIGGKLGHAGGQQDVTPWGIEDEPENVVARFVGRGLSQWRGRTIPFKVRGYITCATLMESHQHPAAGGVAAAAVLRITLVKRHLGAFSNVVRYEGIMSQNGSEIQGSFADGRFRLCQVDPVAHVLAKELSGAWDGESSCRRGGQSSTTWNNVRLSFSPLPSGDGRGWGMVLSGGGDSLWKDQRIPFCVTGRLSLPGLEVELEKQHVEGYHNRIAYFGRLLAEGRGRSAGDKGGGPATTGASGADDAARTVRLVGVYEHGDFVLRRNLPVEFETESDGVGQSTSVLQACMDLFKRCSDPTSSWSMSGGARRSLLVQPTARSFSGTGGPAPPPPQSHAVQAVPPQAMPIRSAVQHPRREALAKVGTNPISDALASWAEGHTNANNSIRRQAQQHRCQDLAKDWRGENSSSPATPVAAAEPSSAGFAAWDVQEPWEHSAAPSTPPPKAHPSALPVRPSVFSTATQDAEPLGLDLTFAATAVSAQAATGVTSLAGRTSGDLDWLDDNARFDYDFGASSTSVAFSISEGRLRGTPCLASDVGGSGTRVAAAAAAAQAAAAATVAPASTIGAGPVRSSNGGPGGSPALIPGSGGGGRTDADSLPGSALSEHELERTIAGPDPNDAAAMFASVESAAKGVLQEFNGWTGMLNNMGIDGGDGGGVGGSSATGAAPGTPSASILGFGGGVGDGGDDLFLSQTAAAGGSSGMGGADRAAFEDRTVRTMLQRTRIDDCLSVSAAAAPRAAETRRTAGVSYMFAKNNENDVEIQSQGMDSGTCENGERAQPPATSGGGGGGGGGGGQDFGLGLGEALSPEPRAAAYKNRPADLCMISPTAVHERSVVPNDAASGDHDGALLAAKVADYRQALMALILGDGVGSVVPGTGEMTGKSRARRGDVEDLRVLRACLSDPAIPDGVHLEMLKSIVISSGGENMALPSGRAAALPTLAGLNRREMNACKICFTGDSDTLFLPCGHLCVCSMCALRVHTCPICRVDIHRIQSVYRS